MLSTWAISDETNQTEVYRDGAVIYEWIKCVCSPDGEAKEEDEEERVTYYLPKS